MANEFVVKNGLIAQNNITVTGSIISTTGITGSLLGTASTASYVLNAKSASYVQNAQSASYSTKAITSSYADTLTVAGTLTAQTLLVQTITSSIDFVTGSTRFGTLSTNTHQFTGSVGMSGSLNVGGASNLNTATVSGSLTVSGSGTIATYNSDVLEITGSLIVTGSAVITGSLRVNGSITGSNAIFNLSTAGGLIVKGVASTPTNLAYLSNNYFPKFYTRPDQNYGITIFDQSEATAIQSADLVNGDNVRTLTLNPYGGSVGIGTSSSIYQFDINTSNYKSLRIQSSDDALITMGSTIASSQFYSIGVSSDTSGQGSNLFWIGTSTDNPSGTLTKNLIINSTGTVYPGANGTQDLGTSSLRWGTIYTSDLSLSNGIGDWTIVEGEDDLFLYNNKKGKVYKFALTEVDPSIATPKKS